MHAREHVGMLSCAKRRADGWRAVTVLATVFALALATPYANAGDSAGGATATASPPLASRGANSPVRLNAPVKSKSPYAAWRAQNEQVEAVDTSGHGHRAQMPAGQTRPRRVPR
jgi:hypothetical protein